MIPSAFVQEWSATTPWPDPRQVEQDLIICRALCDIFNDPWLSERVAFRGGTAINKLLFAHPLRYSEDIDLVQVRPEPIGPTVDAIRRVLSWLGPCRRKAAPRSMHLVFAFPLAKLAVCRICLGQLSPGSRLSFSSLFHTARQRRVFACRLTRPPFILASCYAGSSLQLRKESSTRHNLNLSLGMPGPIICGSGLNPRGNEKRHYCDQPPVQLRDRRRLALKWEP